MITQYELTRIINLCFDAVDKSVMGPIKVTNPENLNQKTVDGVAYNLFLITLQKVLENLDVAMDK